MTLGEMIKEYVDKNSMKAFVKDAKISRAYAYILIAGKNPNGSQVVPTIETIKKVSKGLHKDFDEVFNQLDYDFVVRISGKKKKAKERPAIDKLLKIAKKCSDDDIEMAIALLERMNR